MKFVFVNAAAKEMSGHASHTNVPDRPYWRAAPNSLRAKHNSQLLESAVRSALQGSDQCQIAVDTSGWCQELAPRPKPARLETQWFVDQQSGLHGSATMHAWCCKQELTLSTIQTHTGNTFQQTL